MIRRRPLLTAAAVSLAAPFVARAQSRDTLKIVPEGDLPILDPVFTTATIVRNHGYMVYDTLYGMDADYRMQPQMLAGHSIEDDGRRWILTLRPGLLFHDGTPVLARDCVASIRRYCAKDSFGQALMAVTDELSALDDRRIQFRLHVLGQNPVDEYLGGVGVRRLVDQADAAETLGEGFGRAFDLLDQLLAPVSSS